MVQKWGWTFLLQLTFELGFIHCIKAVDNTLYEDFVEVTVTQSLINRYFLPRCNAFISRTCNFNLTFLFGSSQLQPACVHGLMALCALGLVSGDAALAGAALGELMKRNNGKMKWVARFESVFEFVRVCVVLNRTAIGDDDWFLNILSGSRVQKQVAVASSVDSIYFCGYLPDFSTEM